MTPGEKEKKSAEAKAARDRYFEWYEKWLRELGD